MRTLAILALLSASTCMAAEKPACYKVRGRLAYYNGTPSTRIWIVGTQRILGVPSEDAHLPPNVKNIFREFNDEVFADFVVCPLTKSRKGEMQMVKVESASQLTHRKRLPNFQDRRSRP